MCMDQVVQQLQIMTKSFGLLHSLHFTREFHCTDCWHLRTFADPAGMTCLTNFARIERHNTITFRT